LQARSNKSDCTEKMLLAATQLFSRQGYKGTSTREIARVADVSENTLFRHFEHKEDLFWAVLRSHSSWIARCKESIDGIVLLDSPQIVLPKIVELLIDTVNYRPNLPRLIAIAFLELEWKANAFCQEQLSPIFAAIRRYLTESMKRGQIRQFEPALATAALVTAVLGHSMLSRFLDGEAPVYSDSREATHAYTRFWLDVLAPRADSASGSAPDRDVVARN